MGKRATAAEMRIKRNEHNVSTARAREILGGSFPNLNGRKYTYPKPTDCAAWTALVNKALAMRCADQAAIHSGKTPPPCKLRSKYEYILFHSNPRSRWKRTQRTIHRKMHGLQTGDPRVVHHNDQRHMRFDKSEILTPCEHQQVHGKQCGPASYKRITSCKICRNGKCKPCDSKSQKNNQ